MAESITVKMAESTGNLIEKPMCKLPSCIILKLQGGAYENMSITIKMA